MSIKKRIVIGDIHGHWDSFKQIYDFENPDSVIVLGDYFDNFRGTDESIIECFNNIHRLQINHNSDSSKGEFILLIGNHDYHYFSGIEQYSGYRTSYATFAYYELNKMILDKSIQYVYVDEVNKTIYSHAGVTNTWVNEKNIKINDINDASHNMFRFTYKGYGDCYGDTKYSSPIWVRPNSLWQDMYVDNDATKWTQIVGHTNNIKPTIILKNGKKCYSQEQIDLHNHDGNTPLLYVMDCMPNYYIVETYDNETEKIINREVKLNNIL